MTTFEQDLGTLGEGFAAAHLDRMGMVIVARNWSCREGELDIVAMEGADLVVVEVKTRSSRAMGGPLEQIPPVKVRRLRRLAALWMAESKLIVREVRVDAIGVTLDRRGRPAIEHLAGIGW